MVLISLVPVGQRPGGEQASAGREISVVVRFVLHSGCHNK